MAQHTGRGRADSKILPFFIVPSLRTVSLHARA